MVFTTIINIPWYTLPYLYEAITPEQILLVNIPKPKSEDQNLKNVSWKSNKWWELLVDSSNIFWPTNIYAMPFVRIVQIDVKQNDKSYFLRYGHSQSHCFITDDSGKFYHDCVWFEDVVYLYAFYSAWIFSPLVKLDFIIFDFYNKVKRK